MVRDRFSRFEAHIERLVEGSFARLFSGHIHPREIAVQLARAMEDNVRLDEEGQAMVPHHYAVLLNPTDYNIIFNQEPNLPDALAAEVVEMARAAGLRVMMEPSVTVEADESVRSHRASVRAIWRKEPFGSTQTLAPMEPPEDAGPLALNASLVMGEDQRLIRLERDVINLGRSRENHIILDDSLISRRHAQLRLRFGRYILYDLDSQSGTVVNGETVQEAILQNGDVISLGSLRLIYTEDGEPPQNENSSSSPHDLDETDANPHVDAIS